MGNSYEERAGPRSHPQRAKARVVLGDVRSPSGHAQAQAAVVWELWSGNGQTQHGKAGIYRKATSYWKGQ